MPTIDQLLQAAYSHWNDAGPLGKAGRELHDRNRLDHARTILERAVELDPSDVESWTNLAFVHLRGFAPDEGLKTLRRGIAATDSDVVRSALQNFTADPEEKATLKEQLASSPIPSIRAEILWNRIFAGEAEALDDARRLARDHADDPDTRHNLCWLFLDAKQRGLDVDLKAEGLPLADRRIAEEPDRIFGHWIKVQMLIAEKDWDGVIAATDASLARHPDDETQMHLRGRAYREKGDYDHAVAWLSRAIGAKPSFAGARADLAKTYEAQDKVDLAEGVVREIPTANPSYPGRDLPLAFFLARRERWAEAESVFLESWGRFSAGQRARLRNLPDAVQILARPAVQAALATDTA
ncbi:MAG: tetratricopeptide repeat protein [Planctomycetota bacterium]|nr:tetratricopeptide repeat protein [Planctomycetota bacterium]